jgi:tetratricopeptide (TPR) repeat protein
MEFGIFLYTQKQSKTAEKYFLKVLAKNRDYDVHARLWLSTISYEKGLYSESRLYIQEAENIDKGNDYVNYQWCRHYSSLALKSKADSWFERAERNCWVFI